MIDMSTTDVGQEPQEKVTYTCRVSGVACRKSNDNDNLRLDMRATIVEGPSTGFEARFPVQMLYDSTGQGRTGQWLARVSLLIKKILGDPDYRVLLPTAEGEITPTMKELINAYFAAPFVYIPEKTDDRTGRTYEGHWEVGRVLGPANPADIVEIDWTEVFA